MKTSDRVHPYPWFLVVLLVVCTLLQGCASSTTASPWTRATWNHESAWIGDTGEWRAIVSEHRARLIYLGPKDGKTNLLYAPFAPEDTRPRGGHIFWLGPQSEWTGKWGTWPPPDEWEQLPARLAEVRANWLHLTLPRPDKTRPQLSRAYCWKNGVLHCRVAWAGGVGDHQAIQILQLPPHAIVEALPSPTTTPGFVRFDTKGKQTRTHEALGESATRVSAKTLRMQSRVDPDKYGFPPHTLNARIGDHGLALGAGAWEGVAMESPDHGFDTQVFLGGQKYPFVEIEQLTPRLKNRGETENSVTIWIKPTRRL